MFIYPFYSVMYADYGLRGLVYTVWMVPLLIPRYRQKISSSGKNPVKGSDYPTMVCPK